MSRTPGYGTAGPPSWLRIQDLLGRSSASDLACPFFRLRVPGFVSNEGFVNFDIATEFAASGFILHGRPEPLEREPCDLLVTPTAR